MKEVCHDPRQVTGDALKFSECTAVGVSHPCGVCQHGFLNDLFAFLDEFHGSVSNNGCES